MKSWYNTLTAREQLAIVAGGIIGGALLLYVVVIEPVADRFHAQRDRVQALEQDLAWMRQAAGELGELQSGGRAGSPATDDKAPYLAVDDALRGAGLPQPATLEPAGTAGARLEFDEVAFDPLMSVLARLHRQSGLHVTRAQLTSTAPGMVRARLTLQRAGQ